MRVHHDKTKGSLNGYNMTKNILFSAIVLALLFAHTAQAQDAVPQSQPQMQISFAPLVKRTSPAVVNIYTKRVVKERARMVSPFMNDPFFNRFFANPGFAGPERERVENSLGSGVIIDEDGTIATNTHVVKDALEISVVMADGREFAATKTLIDEKTDLAVLQIDAKGEKLPYLPFADSDALEVGDLVLAIGNPFGVGQTVSSGIVSGLARTGIGPSGYSFFIQTDAAINPGNSGGALVDMQGRLVGINSMIFSKDGGSLGIGFAIPANMVKIVIDASRQGSGKIVRPWTGMNGQHVTSDMVESLGLKRAFGALTTKVHPKGPAAAAGLREGDVVLAIDGKDVQGPEALKYRLATVPMGASVKLKVWRHGKEFETSLVTTPPLEDPARDQTKLQGRSIFAGAVVANISPAVAEDLGGLAVEAGVVVITVEGGNARQLGLQTGDVLKSVNGKDITSVKELQKLLAAEKSNRWQLAIVRQGKILNLLVTL